jgi:hypothetical protein
MTLIPFPDDRKAQAARETLETSGACDAVARAKHAYEDCHVGRQLDSATQAVARLSGPLASHVARLTLVEGSLYLVDALSESGLHVEAEARARQTLEAVKNESDSVLVEARAERALIRAIELAGEPDAAMARYWALYARLDATSSFQASDQASMTRHLEEMIHTLSGVLSAARRDGRARARLFAGRALVKGIAVAKNLQSVSPGVVALYREQAGFTYAWLGDSFRAECNLKWARLGRNQTDRDRLVQRMIDAELALLAGDVASGAAQFRAGLQAFDGLLPRHADSVRALMAKRGLDDMPPETSHGLRFA